MKCTRRQVLIGFFGLVAGGSVATRFALKKSARAVPKPELPFSPKETRAFKAALEHALPGALEAGVPDHVAWWLTNDKYFKNFTKELQEGSSMLDRVSQEIGKEDFADATPEQRDQVFKRFQSKGVTTATFDGARFFERLVTFALEGWLGHPKYGGNRDEVGWKFIGFKPCWWAPRTTGEDGAGPAGHDRSHLGH